MAFNDRAWRSALLAYLVMVSLSTEALAQNPCVCVEHVTTKQVYRGCRLSMGKNDFYSTARNCRANDAAADSKPQAPMTINETTWRIVPAGQGRCIPCEPENREGDAVPRGDEEEIIEPADEGEVN